MEFELEKDNLNPLYPLTPLPRVVNSGTLSPLSNVSGDGGNSTDGSERTLVSGDASGTNLGESITPELSTAHPTPSTESANASDPLQAISASTPSSLAGLEGDDSWTLSTEDIIESTTSRSKPLLALQRLRRITRGQTPLTPSSTGTTPQNATAKGRRGARNAHPPPGGGMMDVFAVMAQINDQLGAAPDLDGFLKIVVGVIQDLTQFHRVLVYQFDEIWNGQVVAELVDWSMTHDLYKGLHFPAGDIPAQASMTCVRYCTPLTRVFRPASYTRLVSCFIALHVHALTFADKVRILYDRDQPTARIVVRSKEDLEQPLDMTHCYLRAMSPIHVKCTSLPTVQLPRVERSLLDLDLGNMGVRASMSVVCASVPSVGRHLTKLQSIMAFGTLWGLVACHSYGDHGMRVSFPVRAMLKLLCQSISRNIERLSYAQRLKTRKLVWHSFWNHVLSLTRLYPD